MVQARWSAAGTGSNFNNTTGDLHRLRQAPACGCRRRLGAIPDADQDAHPASPRWPPGPTRHRELERRGGAWEYVANAEPTSAEPYFCLAATAYAAKQTRKGDLAAAQAVSLAPKLQRLQLKQELKAAKTHDVHRSTAGLQELRLTSAFPGR